MKKTPKSKKQKKKPEMPITKVTIAAKHEFNDKERDELAKELAASISEKQRLEEMKKTAMKDWATRISTVQNTIAEKANKVTSGFEFRDTECIVEYDKPRKGRKQFIRTSDKVVVDERDMTDADRQLLIAEVEKVTAPKDTPKTTVGEALAKAEEKAAEEGKPVNWSEDAEPGAPLFK